MKFNRGLLALCLVFVIIVSLAGLLQKQREAEAAFQTGVQTASAEKSNARFPSYFFISSSQCLNVLAFRSYFDFAGAGNEQAALASNSTRTEIYNFISANPGTHFRAICSGLGLSIGVVQFHLAVLQKAKLITCIRSGRYKRFFTAGRFSRKQMEILAILRLSTVRKILEAFLQRKTVSHRELAARIRISSQGLTWQMNHLRETGLIRESRNGLSISYTLQKTCVPTLTEAMALLETK